MSELAVNGSVLAYARTLRNISLSTAAERLGITEDQLRVLEAGAPLLPLTFLRRMARKYGVNIGVLFMPEPLPAQHRLPKQYRTFKGRPPALSEETLTALQYVHDAIDDIQEIRDRNRSLVPPPELPKVDGRRSPERIAEAERAKFKVPIQEQFGWTPSQAREGWRRAIESRGIFVYFYKMPLTDCLGFSIFDERQIPAICVNDSDEVVDAAKTFTMLHEYCHLLLRKPGISDQGRGNIVERFCNRFAGSFLVPGLELHNRMPGSGPLRQWSRQDMRWMANKFGVTQNVLAIRLEEIGLAQPGFYNRMLKEWESRGPYQPVRQSTAAFTSWADKSIRRLGRKHTSTIFRALDTGAINLVDAHSMIGLRPRHFAEMRQAIG